MPDLAAPDLFHNRHLCRIHAPGNCTVRRHCRAAPAVPGARIRGGNDPPDQFWPPLITGATPPLHPGGRCPQSHLFLKLCRDLPQRPGMPGRELSGTTSKTSQSARWQGLKPVAAACRALATAGYGTGRGRKQAVRAGRMTQALPAACQVICARSGPGRRAVTRRETRDPRVACEDLAQCQSLRTASLRTCRLSCRRRFAAETPERSPAPASVTRAGAAWPSPARHHASRRSCAAIHAGHRADRGAETGGGGPDRRGSAAPSAE